VCLLGGALLRILQYADTRSLWLDEAAVADNILARTLGDLLARPLAHAQFAPPGFLAAVKGAVSLFGPSESVLRLWPLICGLLTLPLFVAVARRMLTPISLLVVCGLLALNGRHVYFSSEVKQYAAECLATAVVLWVSLKTIEALESGRPGWIIALGIVGALIGWMSYTAVLVTLAAQAALGIAAFRMRNGWAVRRVVLAAGISLCGLVPVIVHARQGMTPGIRMYMERSWGGGLAPHSARAVLGWLPKSILEATRYLIGLDGLWVLLTLALVGLGALGLWSRNRPMALLLLSPLAIAMASALVRVYPFEERLTLYLLPPGLLLVGAGMDALARLRWLGGRVTVAACGAVLLSAVGVRTISALPERREELRPVLEAVAERAATQDSLFVYYGAVPAFRYYHERLRFKDQRVRLGRCHRDQWSLYAQDIALLAGHRRVWFVFSHYDVSEQSISESAFMVSCLEQSGRVSNKLTHKGAMALLWEPRSAAQDEIHRSAEGILPENDRKESSWVCDAGPLGPYGAGNQGPTVQRRSS
jgi:hypothetical protein